MAQQGGTGGRHLFGGNLSNGHRIAGDPDLRADPDTHPSDSVLIAQEGPEPGVPRRHVLRVEQDQDQHHGASGKPL